VLGGVLLVCVLASVVISYVLWKQEGH
jgi:hypothetical protein